TLQGLQLPSGKLLDARFVAHLLDDVMACRECFRAMDQPNPRALSRELERVERGAVAAADHHSVAPDESTRTRLEEIRHVTAEGAVLRGGELLVERAGCNHQCPSPDTRRIDFDPSLSKV